MFCMYCGKPTEGEQPVCPQCAALKAAQQAPQEPVYQEPAAPVEQPVYQEPAAPVEQPAPQPVFEQPVYQEPVFEQPVFEQPAAPQQPLWQEAPQQPVWQEPAPAQDTFVLNTPEAAGKKKKKKNKLLTAIIALVTAAALIVGGIFGWPYISNWFNKATSSPKEYNADTLTATVADPDGALITLYGALRNGLMNYQTDAAAEGTLRLQMDEDFLKAMLSAALFDTDLDADDFAFLSDISMKMDVNSKDGAFEIAATPILGKTEIVTLELGMDMQEGAMWFRLPQLSKEYVIYDFSDDMDRPDYDEMESATALLPQIAQVLPEEEVLVRLLEKYIPLALAEIDDVEEKSEKLKAGGIEQSVTAVTSTIDYETFLNMGIAVLEAIEDDKDIKAICDDMDDLVEDLEGMDPDLFDALTEAIPELIEEIEDAKEDADEMEGAIELVTYVDAKGAVTGLSLGFDGTTFIDTYTVRKGNDFATVVVIPEGEIELVGEGTDKDGIINATYELEYQGIALGKVTLVNYDSKGMTKGTVRIQPDKDLFDLILGQNGSGANSILSGILSANLALELRFEGDEKDSFLAIAVVSDGADLICLSQNAKLKSPSSVKVPSDGIDMNNDSPEEWIMGWDLDAVIDNLRKAGVPSDLVEVLETFSEGLKNGFVQSETDTLYPEDGYLEEDYYTEEGVGSGAIMEEEYEFTSTGKVVD